MKKCKECGDVNIVRAESFDRYDPSYLANYYCETCKEFKFPHNLMEVDEDELYNRV